MRKNISIIDNGPRSRCEDGAETIMDICVIVSDIVCKAGCESDRTTIYDHRREVREEVGMLTGSLRKD